MPCVPQVLAILMQRQLAAAAAPAVPALPAPLAAPTPAASVNDPAATALPAAAAPDASADHYEAALARLRKGKAPLLAGYDGAGPSSSGSLIRAVHVTPPPPLRASRTLSEASTVVYSPGVQASHEVSCRGGLVQVLAHGAVVHRPGLSAEHLACCWRVGNMQLTGCKRACVSCIGSVWASDACSPEGLGCVALCSGRLQRRSLFLGAPCPPAAAAVPPARCARLAGQHPPGPPSRRAQPGPPAAAPRLAAPPGPGAPPAAGRAGGRLRGRRRGAPPRLNRLAAASAGASAVRGADAHRRLQQDRAWRCRLLQRASRHHHMRHRDVVSSTSVLVSTRSMVGSTL